MFKYGDKVNARYTPTTTDPNPVTRTGVIVDLPTEASGLYGVFFGSLNAYDPLEHLSKDVFGLFYIHELGAL